MQQAHAKLRQLIEKVSTLNSHAQKSAVIDETIDGIEDDEQLYLLKAMAATGQKKALQPYLKSAESLKELIHSLKAIDRFYGEFGGILGYQAEVLKLLMHDQKVAVEYRPPEAIDIEKPSDEVNRYSLEGIRQMGEMAEMYAIGGAADRLNLIDETSGVALPAAKLKIASHTLLEHMVRDLFGREYLHYKLFGKQLKTPIAMMTSMEKENDYHVKAICSEKKWFGRDPSRFLFFCQPLVPTFTKAGEWAQHNDEKLMLKPGGHGVIWKLAMQEKIFEKLEKMGRKKGLIRQINNPIAGLDFGLSAFTGVGLSGDKKFGFASCPRRENAKEGVNVLKKVKEGWALSNIEYCDSRAKEMEGKAYPANTNILFVDFAAISDAVKSHPYPGVLLNFKSDIARLELTMQNIADFVSHNDAYLTLSPRLKTISAAKKAWEEGKPFLETPEGALLDLMRNHHALMTRCGFDMPSCDDLEAHLFKKLPFYITYHPALGPHYSIIEQKICRGKMEEGSELHLEISDLRMKQVSIAGSLFIEADAIMGHVEEGEVIFSERTSRVILENVEIINKGIDFDKELNYVQGKVFHKQRCLISMGENSEFIAKDVTFRGDYIIRVPQDTRCTAVMKNRKVEFSFEPVEAEQSLYRYEIEKGTNEIRALLEVKA